MEESILEELKRLNRKLDRDSVLCYTPEEVMDLLRIGETKLYELLRRGEIPSFKVGRSRKIPRRHLEEWLERKMNGEGGEGQFQNHQPTAKSI